ncbi:sensor histidine kinase [Longirhabdus pacifica]|uniref:sensor histidine kinase n=1 Tax=Longirhabdus pacifica TaxID=2305227 RepID=UPI001008B428|nr:sensor histidine kinase [Longirhabdus pacifica]
MLLVLIILWSLSVILMMVDKKSKSNRALSLLTFTGGSGALAAVVANDVMTLSVVASWDVTSMKWQILDWTTMVSSVISYYGVPFSFLVFAIQYHQTFQKWNRYIIPVLTIPSWLMLIFTPAYPPDNLEVYPILLIWALPYFVAGMILIWKARKKMPLSMLNNYRFTCIVVLVPVGFTSFFSYILPVLGVYRMWRYNSIVIPIAAILFLYAIFKYGFLGIQLLLNRRQLNHTLQSITSGTTILNHAVKNDIGKIKLFSHKLKSSVASDHVEKEEMQADVEVILNAAKHIEHMIQKLQKQTKEIELDITPIDAKALIEDCTASFSLPNIHVHYNIESGLNIMGDKTHIMEVLNNLIINAKDAMPSGGTISIEGYYHAKYAVIEITDNGTGIQKQHLHKVKDPFFTTKSKEGLNFGLGLAYCSHVLSKHGGSLSIDSTVGEGTTVSLTFPIKERGLTVDGKNKNHAYRRRSRLEKGFVNVFSK